MRRSTLRRTARQGCRSEVQLGRKQRAIPRQQPPAQGRSATGRTAARGSLGRAPYGCLRTRSCLPAERRCALPPGPIRVWIRAPARACAGSRRDGDLPWAVSLDCAMAMKAHYHGKLAWRNEWSDGRARGQSRSGLGCAIAVRMPCRMASGGGGQPGMVTSTGSTFATPPHVA